MKLLASITSALEDTEEAPWFIKVFTNENVSGCLLVERLENVALFARDACWQSILSNDNLDVFDAVVILIVTEWLAKRFLLLPCTSVHLVWTEKSHVILAINLYIARFLIVWLWSNSQPKFRFATLSQCLQCDRLCCKPRTHLF